MGRVWRRWRFVKCVLVFLYRNGKVNVGDAPTKQKTIIASPTYLAYSSAYSACTMRYLPQPTQAISSYSAVLFMFKPCLPSISRSRSVGLHTSTCAYVSDSSMWSVKMHIRCLVRTPERRYVGGFLDGASS